jgi:hypothetical protein
LILAQYQKKHNKARPADVVKPKARKKPRKSKND